jgi:hypothetical protein
MSKFNSQTLSQITTLSKLYESCMEDLIRKEFNWKSRTKAWKNKVQGVQESLGICGYKPAQCGK